MSATSPRMGYPGQGPAVDMANLLAFGELGAGPGGAEERADTRAGGAHPLREVALRDELELDLAGLVEAVEHPGMFCRMGTSTPLPHSTLASSAAKPVLTLPALLETTVSRWRPDG